MFHVFFDPISRVWGDGIESKNTWKKSSKWLDKLVEEHRILKRASNVLLLSASSSYMLNEKEPFEQVLPIYIEFNGMYALYHGRKEEILAILAGLLGGSKHWLIKDLEDLRLIVEDRFKDLFAIMP